MSFKKISGITQQFYQTPISSIDMIKTSPTRDAIFKSLSQISYSQFPEFILDILKSEGHLPIDITDGQGDEKQDILTINSFGERCLTQCKHTIDYKSHYNGDDLDILVTASMRKNCQEAIFVTNSDLTPQGKKYVTDEEYNRGFKNSEDFRKISYWNGYKIWEKIKNNQDIINKWFSGLGQAHEIRTFRFELSIQEMPFKGATSDSIMSKDFFTLLCSKPWVEIINKDQSYIINVSNDYKIIAKSWFMLSGQLNINFVLPDDDLNFFHKPLFALAIEVTVNASLNKYSPTKIRDEIVFKLCDELLPDLPEGNWWHITTNQIKSIIYLYDISEPIEVHLAFANTFVKTKYSKTKDENEYCLLDNDKFKHVESEDGDDSIWIHAETDTNFIQVFEQQINPIEKYNYHIIHLNNLKRISNYDFFAVGELQSDEMYKLQRILHQKWIAFQHNENAIIWAIDPTQNQNERQKSLDNIENLGFKILNVRSEDVEIILKQIKDDTEEADSIFITDKSNISFPIMLDKRVFWYFRDLILNIPIDIEVIAKLLEFKYVYENEHGFDNMFGKLEKKVSSNEVREILFEPLTFRGKRMIDIKAYQNPISINLRFIESRLETSNELSFEYLKEFEKVYATVLSIISSIEQKR